MRYRLYSNTEKAWDAMFAVIQNARASIVWECYILLDDTPQHRFYDLLIAKAQEGVKVKIILDSYGAFWEDMSNIEERLRSSGAEVLYFNRLLPWANHRGFRNWWFTRNHRKVLVVDERVGFVGGVNIGEAYRKWIDLHMRVEGLVVGNLLRSFARTYRAVGGRDHQLLVLAKNPLPMRTRLKTWFITQDSARRRLSVRTYYREKFKNARERITIVTPYFMPHRWFLDALSQARRRGVTVEVMIPRNTENRFLTALNAVFACAARHKGIRILTGEKMNHAKAMLIDGVEGMIGSANIDANSFDNNWEANLAFRRRDMVAKLNQTMDRWKLSAKDFDCVGLHHGWLHRFAKIFVGALHSFL